MRKHKKQKRVMLNTENNKYFEYMKTTNFIPQESEVKLTRKLMQEFLCSFTSTHKQEMRKHHVVRTYQGQVFMFGIPSAAFDEIAIAISRVSNITLIQETHLMEGAN
jgi:hypothetical protein